MDGQEDDRVLSLHIASYEGDVRAAGDEVTGCSCVHSPLLPW